jgi:hypothetical protein
MHQRGATRPSSRARFSCWCRLHDPRKCSGSTNDSSTVYSWFWAVTRMPAGGTSQRSPDTQHRSISVIHVRLRCPKVLRHRQWIMRRLPPFVQLKSRGPKRQIWARRSCKSWRPGGHDYDALAACVARPAATGLLLHMIEDEYELLQVGRHHASTRPKRPWQRDRPTILHRLCFISCI